MCDSRKCQCGKAKDPLSNVCRACYTKNMRATLPKKQIGGAHRAIRECNACLEKFECFANSKQKSCERCQKMLQSMHSLEKVLRRNIEICVDNRKKLMLEKLLERQLDDQVDLCLENAEKQAKVKEVFDAMKLVKKKVRSNGRWSTKKMYRCAECGALCIKRKCVYCEVKIVSGIR